MNCLLTFFFNYQHVSVLSKRRGDVTEVKKSVASCSFYKLNEKREENVKEKTFFFSCIKFPRSISAQVVVSMENLTNDVGSEASLYSLYKENEQ